jgi:hypothetical protein
MLFSYFRELIFVDKKGCIKLTNFGASKQVEKLVSG